MHNNLSYVRHGYSKKCLYSPKKIFGRIWVVVMTTKIVSKFLIVACDNRFLFRVINTPDSLSAHNPDVYVPGGSQHNADYEYNMPL